MEEVSAARLARNVLRQSRAWKAFLLSPQLLFHKPPHRGLIPKKRWEKRLVMFARGNWLPLLRELASKLPDDQKPHWRRAARALQLVQMGELSSGREAMEGAELAPSTMATLAELTDPDRRPVEPIDLLHQ